MKKGFKKKISALLCLFIIFILTATSCGNSPTKVETTEEATIITVPPVPETGDLSPETTWSAPETTALAQVTAVPPTETAGDQPNINTPVTTAANPTTVGSDAELPSVWAAKSAFAYSDKQGIVYMKGEADAKLYPASITKLACALTALEYAEPDMICSAEEAELSLVNEGSSVAYIKQGHKLTVEMLIEAMLLPSGCDASYVLAASVGQVIKPDASRAEAVTVFVDAMNKWASENGMTNTHFTNPDGYHNDDHYSCMSDIITLAKLSSECESITKFASLPSDDVVYASGHTNTWSNTNLMLLEGSPYYNKYCTGLKTGQTIEAGICLLASFEKDGEMLLTGVFGCPDTATRFRVSNELQKAFLK